MDEKFWEAFFNSLPSLGSALVPLASNMLDTHSLPMRHNARCAGLVGAWKGVLGQRNGVVRESSLSCILQERKHHIYGEFTLESEAHGKPLTMFLRSASVLWDGHFFMSYYVGSIQGRDPAEVVSFGNILLHLSMDCSTLAGYFHGVGPFSGKLVYGRMLLTKEPKK